jgi:hypothetical protein
VVMKSSVSIPSSMRGFASASPRSVASPNPIRCQPSSPSSLAVRRASVLLPLLFLGPLPTLLLVFWLPAPYSSTSPYVSHARGATSPARPVRFPILPLSE